MEIDGMNTGNDGAWFSMDETDPDYHYGSTLDNLENLYGVSSDLRCIQIQAVVTSEIDPARAHDDPEDDEGLATISRYRKRFRTGAAVSAVVVVHHSAADYPYNLIEGMHRFTAALREALERVPAYLVHPGCCGAPKPDVRG
jgi:hypothetical protein